MRNSVQSPAPAPFRSSLKPFFSLCVIYLVAFELIAVLVFSRTGFIETADFRCFYAAGTLARTDPSHLYDLARQRNLQVGLVGAENGWLMFIQPPYEALRLAPFSLLSYRSAYLLMIACNIILTIPCVVLAPGPFSNRIDPWQPAPGLLFFVFPPFFWAIAQGQSSILLLLLSCAAWHELERGKNFNAGLLLALALFKLQIVIPLAFLLICWRGLSVLAGFALGTGVVGALSIWLVGLRGLRGFLNVLGQAATAQVPSTMPNLRGLLYGLAGPYLPPLYFTVLTLALSLALLIWITTLLRTKESDVAFALALVAALLASYHLNSHDLTLLLLPIALLAARPTRLFTIIVIACFALPPALLVLGGRTLFLFAVPLFALVLLAAREPMRRTTSAYRLEVTE
jgi:Protein of unknown function (DUF2029).